MGLLSLYHRSPIWLQNLALSTYGARLKWLRSGATRRQIAADLRVTQWRSLSETRTEQLAALNGLLAHSVASVPYYAERLSDAQLPLRNLSDLAGLPLLTKDDVRVAGRALISRQNQSGTLQAIHTGGTTGKPLTVYCDRRALQRNYAFYDRLLEWAGVGPGSRTATFAGRPIVPPDQDLPPFWRHNYIGRALLCSSYHISPATIPSYLAALAHFNPTVIDSYPSSIAPLAQHLLRVPARRPHPKAVVTSSETLSLEMRAQIAEAFSCPVFDHYGAAEMVAFISQCERGTYHINAEYGIVEILVDGRPAVAGESGDLVATGFVNPVMPLLRYQTGDRAVRGDDYCPCGRSLPTLERIEGRQDDVVRTPEGRLVGRLDPIFKSVGSLFETQIIQDRLDHIRVEMVTTDDFTDSDAAGLARELRLRLGPSMQIELKRVPKIARTRGGKLRSVVSLVNSTSAEGLPPAD